MSETQKPNILFICADQWRADCVSALGHPHVRTPNLDRLISEESVVENHFGQCTPCGPSRTSLLTGMYLINHRSGRNGTPLDARHTNVALEARKQGYEPALFGYTDTSIDPRGKSPADPALQAYDEGVMPGFVTPLHLPEEMGPWVADLISKGYDFPTGRAEVFRPRRGFEKPTDRGFRYIPTEFPAEESETAFLTNAFLNWLKVRHGRPWFAHFVFFRPHPPLIAPEPYNAMVNPNDVALPVRAATPEDEARQHPLLEYSLNRLRRPAAYDELNPTATTTADDLEIRQMMATYFGLIAEVDTQLGRIIEALKSSGEYDRTLIIVTSDHGEMLGEHYMWSKEIYYDPSFHVPLVIHDPRPEADGTRGRRVTQFTQAIDVAPTIIDWIGGDIPRTMDGESLVPFLESDTPEDWREQVFFEHDFRNVASQAVETALGIPSDHCSYAVIRDANYKYIHFAALPPLLFDMKADPHEMHNLVDDPALQPVVVRYAQKMLSWRLTEVDRTLTNMELTKQGLVSRP